ncbi:hypothetical protein HYDPIDRAFT_116312 [Hydnomerulius pinastri MD-312]|uniref:Uncharacterized protein n=1 Tax=Hydnomerulius pinastri MD-312 TaxID=994086 RepID=A0A0C9WBB4_9AGAM|nr:hypothetical protein HYDPIDRAFT_116312 [Hydnomerulius pinastri MD-312]
MVSLKASVLTALSFVALSTATCSYSNQGNHYELYVFNGVDCSGTDFQYLYGSKCECRNLNSQMEDNVYSFAYTASTGVNVYTEYDCTGVSVGESGGDWLDRETIHRNIKSFWLGC